MKKVKCPICKRSVDPGRIIADHMPVVDGKKVTKKGLACFLSECCGTLWTTRTPGR